MAAAFKVTNSSDIASAFAAHDEFLSRVSVKGNGGEISANKIGDDFYTAPFELLRKDDGTCFIVFTCYKTRGPHYESSDEMGKDAPLVAPGSIAVREILNVQEKDQFQFREYAWAMGEDVNAALEDKAVKITCEKMGWEIPAGWRDDRIKQSVARRVGLAPIWDLVQNAPSGPSPPRAESSSPSQEGKIPGIQACYSMEPGDDIGSFIGKMFGDIHQRPKDHLAAWKEKNSM
ncbi:hypothetical protein ACHAXR_006961 [Thalassiosira sp. AJA248-18]